MVLNELQKSPIQTIVTLMGLVVVILNMFLAYQLNPLTQDLRSVTQRVEAIEIRNKEVDPLVLVTKIEFIMKDIQELKQDIKQLLLLNGVK